MAHPLRYEKEQKISALVTTHVDEFPASAARLKLGHAIARRKISPADGD